MARLYHAGAEIDAGIGTAAQNRSPDGVQVGTGTITRDTTVFRSGVASWKFDQTASNLLVNTSSPAPTFVDGVTYYARCYVRATAAPAQALIGPMMFGTTNQISCTWGTAGGLRLRFNNANNGVETASICDSQWHRIELKGVAAASTVWTDAELLVDGVSQATATGSVARTNVFSFGILNAAAAAYVINIDDVALNDSSGAANNTYPGAGNVVLLKPTADSAGGTGWRLGTNAALGGNGFAAVDNTPPLGVADLAVGSDPKQIRNATSNANDSYDATMTSYTAAGAGASDTVNAVVQLVATAAPVTTNAKQGTFGIVSNPNVANVALDATGTSGAFWAGATAGTFGAGWKWSTGAYQNAPSVTLGTAPVTRITQVTSSTRIAMVCFMGIYADYTPAVATTLELGPEAILQAVNRASVW